MRHLPLHRLVENGIFDKNQAIRLDTVSLERQEQAEWTSGSSSQGWRC